MIPEIVQLELEHFELLLKRKSHQRKKDKHLLRVSYNRSRKLNTSKRTKAALKNQGQWVEHYRKRMEQFDRDHPDLHYLDPIVPRYRTDTTILKLLMIAVRCKGSWEERLEKSMNVCQAQAKRKDTRARYEWALVEVREMLRERLAEEVRS